MKRVREVSMVEREVAETVRVTLRPKKLKPLQSLSVCDQRYVKKFTYPILIMIRTELIAMAGLCVIW